MIGVRLDKLRQSGELDGWYVVDEVACKETMIEDEER